MLYESPYGTIAEILTSPKVGLTHLHLVGDIIVAQSTLDEWFAENGKARLSPDDWVEIAERVLVVEDEYKLLWQELHSQRRSIEPHELRDLENALRNTASTLSRIYEDLRRKHG